MKRLFFFVIDSPEVVCAYLAKQIMQNKKSQPTHRVDHAMEAFS